MVLTLVQRPGLVTKREALRIGTKAWPASLVFSAKPSGLIVLADDGTGTLCHARNLYFAKVFQSYGLGTLLCDFRTEQEADVASAPVNVQLFVARLMEVLRWLQDEEELADLPIGLMGSSTASASALIVAAHEAPRVGAVVSRAGRPDLAQAYLPLVRASTLLIVGSRDHNLVKFNRAALDALVCKKRLDIIPSATLPQNESAALDVAAGLAGHWFEQHLTDHRASDHVA